MVRYSFKIQYQGKNYAGSQIQFDKDGKEKPIPTIQGELEKAICTLIGVKPTQYKEKRPIKTVFSGRTDSGVNSLGQVVHVDLDKNIVASNFVRSLNGLLPKDISVSELSEVSEEFHAQKSAKVRYYEYVFVNRQERQAFDNDLMRIEFPIDLERMNQALEYIKGSHDFMSFKNAGSSNPYSDCIIYDAVCIKVGTIVIFKCSANRFLYKMIRTIVGTLLEIEKNNLSPDYMKKVLEAKNRKLAGKTVNPCGLTLIKVEY